LEKDKIAEKQLHLGHRKRWKGKFRKDVSCMEDHELLEGLLFFPIQRRDTNEISHMLINRSGSLRGIFSKSEAELRTVDGIGENSSLYLRIIGETISRIMLSICDTKKLLSSEKELELFLCGLFFSTPFEETHIILFDKKDRYILNECIGKGDAIGSPVNLRKIIAFAKENGARSIILAHNHINGLPLPSERDEEITRTLSMALESNHIHLIEHYIVANDKAYPIIHK
jgi:DNA repair protein RadC